MDEYMNNINDYESEEQFNKRKEHGKLMQLKCKHENLIQSLITSKLVCTKCHKMFNTQFIYNN